MCALNQLVIGGSIFPQKRIHKATWRSPDHVTENQIDHICINQRFRRSCKDVRVIRGADVASDHHLVVTQIRLRLKKLKNQRRDQNKSNIGLVRERSKQESFRLSLVNRYAPLQELIEDESTDIETHWKHRKELWIGTYEEVLGKRVNHKEWISEDTIQKIEARKEKKNILNLSRTKNAKAKAQKEHAAANKEVKARVKKDKNNFVEELANQAEEAAGQGNLKDLYMLTRKLSGKFQQSNMPIRDREGQMLMTTEQQLKQWVEHFTDLLNRPTPKEQPNISQAEVDLPISVKKPSKEELKKAIRTLKNGKAAGPNEIPAEALKADIDTATDILHNLYAKIWDEEKVPADWREGLVIKLLKKGDLRDCSNYRGIMLIA